MTAKLPPRWVPINLMQLNATQLRHVQSYSKTFALQAVREALERAVNICYAIEDGEYNGLKRVGVADECAFELRALLKEYSDDRS